MQLCRIHLASARKASVQPYIFFFAFWEEKPESRMTIQADTGSSTNTWVPPTPVTEAICRISQCSPTHFPECY